MELPTDVHPALAGPDEIGQVVYAVVQESLTNVLRHARARRAVVSRLLSGGRFTVTVADDGAGCTIRSATGTGIADGVTRFCGHREFAGAFVKLRTRWLANAAPQLPPGFRTAARSCVPGRFPVPR
ncbi:hypothetical protein GCM10022223_24200 [Kineosporia mesophila]|uniref:Histidine kinase/HSP90-like ATPase domain-containing protein n=1 Tax=Kineosporia mesophila TaxID=566012 RepID=A0ABP6ZES8_9ACTN